MFNHESESLAEAIGIKKEILFQENLDFYTNLEHAMREKNLERVMGSLSEKPRVLVAALGILARQQVLSLCSVLKDKSLIANVLGLCAEGVRGLDITYSLRPSEEVELLSVLPQQYLSTQAITWGLSFLAMTRLVTGNET